MTCFWDGILSKISTDHINYRLGTKYVGRIINHDFINELKKRAVDGSFDGVKWDGQPLSQQQVVEFCTWITEYNIADITSGHLCSVCDPFLSIICGLMKVNIQHNYNGSVINYVHDQAAVNVVFTSDTGHFW